VKNVEKIIIPLGIGAAVIGIWSAFRRQAPAPTQVLGPTGVQLPPIPPLEDTHYGISTGDYTTPVPGAGGGHTSHGHYLYRAAADPLSQSLGMNNLNLHAESNPYAYMLFNLPPWDSQSKSMAEMTDMKNGKVLKKGAAGGCGCGGGFIKDLIRRCSRDRTPRILDGHGDCLTVNPEVLHETPLIANTTYAASSFDVTRYGVPQDMYETPAGPVIQASAAYF